MQGGGFTTGDVDVHAFSELDGVAGDPHAHGADGNRHFSFVVGIADQELARGAVQGSFELGPTAVLQGLVGDDGYFDGGLGQRLIVGPAWRRDDVLRMNHRDRQTARRCLDGAVALQIRRIEW